MALYFSGNTSVQVACSTTAARTALPASTVNSPQSKRVVEVHNIGATNYVYVAFGNSAVDALATTGVPVAPNQAKVFLRNGADTHVSLVTSTSTSTAQLSFGTEV